MVNHNLLASLIVIEAICERLAFGQRELAGQLIAIAVCGQVTADGRWKRTTGGAPLRKAAQSEHPKARRNRRNENEFVQRHNHTHQNHRIN